MWQEGNRIHLETKVAETGKAVLTGAYIDLKSVASAPAPAPAVASTGLLSETVFAEMKRRLDAKPEVGAKINAVYQWNILSNKKPAASWGKFQLVNILLAGTNDSFGIGCFSCGFESQSR
jgi:3-hydroxyacyl-CoA dehydrogenase/3a,7a,12a-trihydroxy-5b-cholest-24-enoyl-CoA hydratase